MKLARSATYATALALTVMAATAAAQDAQVRVIHLSPNTPAVDVFVNGGAAPAIANLAFPTSTPYVPLPPGTYDFGVVVAGSPLGTPGTNPIDVTGVTLDGDTDYTVAAIGLLGEPTPFNLQPLLLVDDVSTLNQGETRLQVVHAGAGIPDVDILLLGDTGNTGVPLLSEVMFGQSGIVDADLSAGARVGIDVGGTGVAELTFTVPPLPPNVLVNVFAVNDGGSVFLRAQLPDGTTVSLAPENTFGGATDAQVRVIHLSPNAGNVDVLVNGATPPLPPLTDIAFLEARGFLAVPAATYDFDVVATGTTTVALPIPGVALAAGSFSTAAAIGAVGEPDALQALLLDDDRSGIPAGEIALNVVHAGAGIPGVSVLLLGGAGDNTFSGQSLLSDVTFGQFATLTGIGEARYRLGIALGSVAVGQTGNADLAFDLPFIPAGLRANVFAVNRSVGGLDPVLVLQLANEASVVIEPQEPPVTTVGDWMLLE